MKKTKLVRYELEQSVSCGKPIANFKIRPKGSWVFWNDVEPYIKEGLRTATSSSKIKCPECGHDIKITATQFLK